MSAMRKRGEGTLRLRKDGRWEGRVVVGYNEGWLPITKNVVSPDKEKCIEKLEALKQKCGYLTRKVTSDMPFGEWLDVWYNTYSKPSLRPNTQYCYESRIYQHIIPAVGNIPLNKMKQSDLQQFYAKLKNGGRLSHTDKFGQGLSDRMVRGCHATCRSALEKAVNEGLIRTNPAIGCSLPPKKAREMQILTHDEMQRFLIQAKEDDFYEIALLELSTGMRRGELCGLQWNDIDFETGELHISRQAAFIKGRTVISEPKTSQSNRVIILPSAVINILKLKKEKTNSEWVFPSPIDNGRPIDPQSIYKKMKTILEKAQCRSVRFHDLRHTFATTALEYGMDIKTLSAIIGHVSSATTIDIYSHITNNMQAAAASKIENSIGNGEATEHEVNKDPEPKEKFEAVKRQTRKPGTGGIYQINEKLFEGRYSPRNAQGNKESHNVYAHTREECEEKLKIMIEEVKAKISEEKKSVVR